MLYGNRGYVGNRMSIRAVQAYEDDMMPLSKWTKTNILCAIENLNYSISNLSKLTKRELKYNFLEHSEWHHTGSFYNKTDFYRIDEDKLQDFMEDEKNNINNIIEKRIKIEPKQKIEKEPIKYVTALVRYDHWTGTRKHPKKEVIEEVVHFMSDDKMVKTSVGNKRLSSLFIVKKVEQKTKFAHDNRVMK